MLTERNVGCVLQSRGANRDPRGTPAIIEKSEWTESWAKKKDRCDMVVRRG